MSNYLSLSGAAGEYASVPDTNLLDADTAHGVQGVGLWNGNAGDAPAVVADSDAWGSYAIEQIPSAFDQWLKMNAAATCPQVSGSTEYTISAQVKGINLKTGRDLFVYVIWLDSGLSQVGVDTGTAVALVEGQYVDVSVTGTTPATAQYARIRFAKGPTVGDFDGSETLRLGSAILRAGSDATFVPSLRIVSDLDMRAKIAIPSAGTNLNTSIVFGALDNNLYLTIRDDNRLRIIRGTWNSTHLSAATYDVTGPLELRATLDVSTGDADYYVDGVYQETVNGAITAQAAPTVPAFDVPNRSASIDPTNIYWVEVRDGIGGPVVCRTDFANVTPSELEAASFTSDEGHTVTLNGNEWAYVRPIAGGILSRAELLLQADDGNNGASPKWADRSGNDHHAQLGWTAGADTNDPEWLPHSGENYVRLPGSSGNYVSSADVNLLDADTAHLHQSLGGFTDVLNGTGLAQSTALSPVFGDYHMAFDADGVGVAYAYINNAADRIPASVSTDYSGAAYASTDTAGVRARVAIRIYTSSSSGYTYGDYVDLVPGVWSLLTVDGAFSADAVTARIEVQFDKQGGGACDLGTKCYSDAYCIEQSSTSQGFVPSLRIVGDLDLRIDANLDFTTRGCQIWRDDTNGGIFAAAIGYGFYDQATPGLMTLAAGRASDGASQAMTADASAFSGVRKVYRGTIVASTGAAEVTADGVSLNTATLTLGGSIWPSAAANTYVGDSRSAGQIPVKGGIYSVEVRDGIGGPVVARYDADDAAEPFATQTDSESGRTWTYNRSGSGLYVVDRPAFGLHTDDYMIVADHANLDFAANESLTTVAVVRQQAFPTGATQCYIAKRASNAASAAGWSLYPSYGSVAFEIADGTVETSDLQATEPVNGYTAVAAGRRNVAADNVEVFIDGSGTGSPTTDLTTATLATTEAVGIGALNVDSTPNSFLDGEVMAVALFREALTDDEIAAAGAALLGGSVGRMLLLGVG